MVHAVPGFRPVREKNVALIGSRSATPVEKVLLRASEATVVEEQSVRALVGRGALGPALDAAGGRVRRVHVHLDLDVLDPDAVNPANEFAPEGGYDGRGSRSLHLGDPRALRGYLRDRRFL